MIYHSQNMKTILKYIILLAVIVGLTSCSEEPTNINSTPQQILLGDILPVRFSIMFDAQNIKLKAECTVAQDYEYIEFKYRNNNQDHDQQTTVPNNSPCVPGSTLYESSPQFAIPLAKGQDLHITATIRYRDGSTRSITHTYHRNDRNEIVKKD